jgi:hypothetical protein
MAFHADRDAPTNAQIAGDVSVTVDNEQRE